MHPECRAPESEGAELERAAGEWRASASVFEALEGRGDASAWIG